MRIESKQTNQNTKQTHFERDLYDAGEHGYLGEFHIAEDLDLLGEQLLNVVHKFVFGIALLKKN